MKTQSALKLYAFATACAISASAMADLPYNPTFVVELPLETSAGQPFNPADVEEIRIYCGAEAPDMSAPTVVYQGAVADTIVRVETEVGQLAAAPHVCAATLVAFDGKESAASNVQSFTVEADSPLPPVLTGVE